jgi:hypothetical protein
MINRVTIRILGLGSTNKKAHVIFGFLSLAYVIQHDDLHAVPSIFLQMTLNFLYG